jgi:UDP-2-acetamido-2,6-beta-L-arabino-hexul-4-ose reductase
MKTVLITGADGFIGRNLALRLAELGGVEVMKIGRGQGEDALADAAARAGLIFHLAGVNRPKHEGEFHSGNPGFSEKLCRALEAAGNAVPIVYASSIQAEFDNPYGASKLAAERALLRHGEASGATVHLFRLSNVFGKWARPNYNSAVATFCHNIARDEPISIHDPAAALRLNYIDDVIHAFLEILEGRGPAESGLRTVSPVYETTVGAVAALIAGFRDGREAMIGPRGGEGLERALYATYLTYLRPEDFAYSVPVHADSRGQFVEMLKTADSGQFSYFTAGPGITRGNHYHHTKAEKFLVIAGKAHFGFRHVVTGETHEIVTSGDEARIVETIPGWTHNITNVGDERLVVMLWANEVFDPLHPDTIAMKV